MKNEKPPTPAPEEYRDVHFPAAGLDLSLGFGQQPNRPTGVRGEYRRTCAVGVNVRAYDPKTGRSRGGSRAGIKKYFPDKVAGDVTWLVQDLAAITHKG